MGAVLGGCAGGLCWGVVLGGCAGEFMLLEEVEPANIQLIYYYVELILKQLHHVIIIIFLIFAIQY